ncbi:MAG TPA: hypothetical protein VHO73_08990 [Methylomirabilota bacterium]|jgi:hypothetical protein|nr:hypothetical protein [Methylomirabilota bacterium]
MRRIAAALGAAGQRLAERLAYRPREVVVVTLLAAGLFGGLLVERWRVRHPATAEQLEVEPVRKASPPPVAAAPRLRARTIAARCGDPGPRGRHGSRGGEAFPDPRLDLNRATPGELARVAGISWRLAARIVAAREAFEGRGVRWVLPDDAGPTPPPAPEPRDRDVPEEPTDTESP